MQESNLFIYFFFVTDDSNKIIDKTIQQHRTYGGAVRQGKGYVTKLKRREFTDRLLIFFGIMVFLLVVLCIWQIYRYIRNFRL